MNKWLNEAGYLEYILKYSHFFLFCHFKNTKNIVYSSFILRGHFSSSVAHIVKIPNFNQQPPGLTDSAKVTTCLQTTWRKSANEKAENSGIINDLSLHGCVEDVEIWAGIKEGGDVKELWVTQSPAWPRYLH